MDGSWIRDLEVAVVITALIFGAAFACFYGGYHDGGKAIEESYQEQGIGRGYAELVMPENPRKKPSWRWIEPEVE